MKAIRALSVVVVVGMAAAIIFGFATGNFSAEGSEIWGLAWGKVSLIDLYLGLAVFGAWIAYREANWARTVVWWVLLVVLGNLTAGLYLAYAAFTSSDARRLLLGSRHG